jgi:outer membrane protein assembly factor BamB
MSVVFRRLHASFSPHRPTIVRIVMGCLLVAGGLIVVGGAIRVLRAADRPTASALVSGTPALGWTASVDGPVTGLAEGEDALYVTGEQLTVFPTVCPTVDDFCTSSWHAGVPDGPLSAPSVRDGRVFVGSARGQVYAFPARCDATSCLPEWVGVAGEGSVSQPVVNDDFVYVTSDRLYAFPAACATDDLACPPAWSAEVPGGAGAGPPAAGDGLVVVGSASMRGDVTAFPAVCGQECRPVWFGRTNGPSTSVAIGDGFAYAIARGQLWAFPLSCTDRCLPAWRGRFRSGRPFTAGATEAPVPAGDRVLVGDERGRLWVFPASCDSLRCEAVDSFEVATAGLLAPVADGDVVAVTSVTGSIAIVDLGCRPEEAAITAAPTPTTPSSSIAASASGVDESCEPVQTRMLGAASRSAPALGGDAVYTADDRGTVLALPRA